MQIMIDIQAERRESAGKETIYATIGEVSSYYRTPMTSYQTQNDLSLILCGLPRNCTQKQDNMDN